MTLDDFKQVVDLQLPDNNTQQITAEKLRAVLKALAETVNNGGFD